MTNWREFCRNWKMRRTKRMRQTWSSSTLTSYPPWMSKKSIKWFSKMMKRPWKLASGTRSTKTGSPIKEKRSASEKRSSVGRESWWIKVLGADPVLSVWLQTRNRQVFFWEEEPLASKRTQTSCKTGWILPKQASIISASIHITIDWDHWGVKSRKCRLMWMDISYWTISRRMILRGQLGVHKKISLFSQSQGRLELGWLVVGVQIQLEELL